MTPEEYLKLQHDGGALILGSDLVDQTDRTLLFGFNYENMTHHVYLKDGVIHTVRYMLDKEVHEHPVFDNTNYLPGKRTYPTRSDFEFCLKLQHVGMDPCYTTYDKREFDMKRYGVYFGRTLDQPLVKDNK